MFRRGRRRGHGRRAAPEHFEAKVDATYVRENGENSLRDIVLTFDVRFPEGEAGDGARMLLPRAIKASHDRTCTVSRTIESGAQITVRTAGSE